MITQPIIEPAKPDYQLQACRNLEQEFSARGDRESARHFQQRIRILLNNKKTGGAK